MTTNPLNQAQPDFNLIQHGFDVASTEIQKCSNIPAVQQGDAILQALRGITTRLDGIDATLTAINARLDRMDARFDRMDARFDRMDTMYLVRYSNIYPF